MEGKYFPVFKSGEAAFDAIGEGIESLSGFEVWSCVSGDGALSVQVNGEWYLWEEPLDLSVDKRISVVGPSSGDISIRQLGFYLEDGRALVSEAAATMSVSEEVSAIGPSLMEKAELSKRERRAKDRSAPPFDLVPSPRNPERIRSSGPIGEILFVRPEGGEYSFSPDQGKIRKLRSKEGILKKEKKR